MKNTHNKSESEILRQKAEDLLKKKSPTTVSALSEAETLKLIHELEVHQFELVIQNEELKLHQVELEIQNNELTLANEQAETDAKKYTELYDFAPSGYFTLSKDGTIVEVNIIGATMLGKDRSKLKSNRFGFFVSNDKRTIFNLFLDKVFSSKANESCDVTLSTRGKLPMYVHLTGIVARNGEQCIVTVEDITESRIMTALQQSEQRYRAVVEWSPYSIVIHRDLKIIYVNPAAIKMFGASSAEDFVGTKILDRVHPDCHQIVLDRIRRGIDDGINAPLTELKYFKFDGTIIDVEVQGTPITYDGALCIHAAMRDITERKQAEAALRESEANLRISHLYTRSLIEASLDPLLTINTDGKISDVNSATENATGLSRNQLIGTDFSDYFTEPEKAKIGYQKVFEQGQVINYPLTICHASGKLIEVQYNASVFKDEHGKILGVFAAARDITELLQVEKKLRKSEKTHHSLFEISLQGIVYQDSEGLIVNANPAAQRILGLTLDQMQGRTSFHPDWRAMKEDGSDFPGEEHPAIVSLRTRKVIQNVIMGVFNPIDEIVHWIKVSASPLFSEGKSAPYMVFTVFEDITVEEEIKRKNEQLFQVNAEKDKFFSIIAHDLRCPFNGFLGLSKMMAEDLPALTLEQVQKMASGMRDSATNLFRLLENLLEWSRLQRDITPFEPESFLLMCMMTESMRPVMDSANKKEIEISYEIPADLEVFADKYMLASTIRNLASNAVKFTRKGGKVTISAKPAPGHSVEISVRDTGIGMSPQMVAGLFRLDVKSNRKGTDNEPSTGLGLLLCKDFVEKYGGKLWVKSEEGKGSVFYFTIPYHVKD